MTVAVPEGVRTLQLVTVSKVGPWGPYRVTLVFCPLRRRWASFKHCKRCRYFHKRISKTVYCTFPRRGAW